MNINTNRSRAWWLLFPSVLFLLIGFIYPVGTFLLESFKVGQGVGLANYSTYFADEINLEVYWRTVRIALLVTLLSAALSYPAALAIMRLGGQYRGLLTGLTAAAAGFTAAIGFGVGLLTAADANPSGRVTGGNIYLDIFVDLF